jgi:steroid delta-isomerase-like uncharacterized protein
MPVSRNHKKEVLSMSNEHKLIAKFETMINTADESLAAELIAEDAIFYAPTQPEPLKGPKGYLFIVQMMRSAFSDIQWHLADCVIEPNKIAVCWNCTGTHDGEFMGHPATGKTFKVRCMNFYELQDGKFISDIGNPDILGILIQTGILQ